MVGRRRPCLCVEQKLRERPGLKMSRWSSCRLTKAQYSRTCAARRAVPGASRKVEAVHVIQLMASKAPDHIQGIS